MTIEDVKMVENRIEDFTVHLTDIPIPQKAYFNDPDLFCSILVPHLETEVTYELEKQGLAREEAEQLA